MYAGHGGLSPAAGGRPRTGPIVRTGKYFEVKDDLSSFGLLSASWSLLRREIEFVRNFSNNVITGLPFTNQPTYTTSSRTPADAHMRRLAEAVRRQVVAARSARPPSPEVAEVYVDDPETWPDDESL